MAIPNLFLERLKFNQPHQFKYLVNPTEQEVVYAARNISHHLFIESNRGFDRILKYMKWERCDAKYQESNQHHFVNFGYIPESWEDLWGWYNYHEYYKSVAERLPTRGKAVEIGTFHGRSSQHLGTLLKRLNKATDVYTIDNYIRFDAANWTMPSARYLRNIEVFKHINNKNIHLICSKSTDAARHFEDRSIDFLFIDGNHSYSQVKADIQTWLPKLKLEGTISGHDYHSKIYPGCVKAVDETFGKDRVKLYPGTVWEVQQPNITK